MREEDESGGERRMLGMRTDGELGSPFIHPMYVVAPNEWIWDGNGMQPELAS
jgi:hypothetical protein